MAKHFDFDRILYRRGTDSLKWDCGENELPMWVADMDFDTAPAVREAILERAAKGAFGYTVVPERWNKAYASWWRNRHGFAMEEEWLTFCTGVIPALSALVRKLTTPAEKVMVMTPVYNIFFNCIINNGRFPAECPLVYDGENYSVDWEAFERTAEDPQVTMLLLCNPQNPIGIVWDRETLACIGEICSKNAVLVVSDEIHCDLVTGGEKYTPFASVNETNLKNSVTTLSASKAFNLAGLQSAAVVVSDKVLRRKARRGLNTDECAEPNVFAAIAAAAAFEEGGEWLDELVRYIGENKAFVKEYLAENIPTLKDVSRAATYLCWIDAKALQDKCDEKQVSLAGYLRKNTGLWLSDGSSYGPAGSGFLRMNVACPRAVLEDGLKRLEKGVEMLLVD